MATVPITIEVDEQTAKVYVEASPKERCKIELRLSLRLREYANSGRRSLEEVMDEMASERKQWPDPGDSGVLLRGHDN